MRNWRIILPLTLLISAGLLIFALLIYYSTGDHFVQKTKKIWQGNLFSVVQGQGIAKDQILLIGPDANEETTLATLPIDPLSARNYDELRWHIEMPDLSIQLRFIWITDSTPQFQRWAELPSSNRGRLPLAQQVPGWEGTIVGIGLEVEGSLLEPLTLHTLELRRAAPDASEILKSIWQEWSSFERWRGVSINTLSNGSGAGLFPPVLAVAAWIGLTALLWITLLPLTRRLWSLVLLLIVGWVLLDIRWQGELWYNWALAQQQYSGKSAAERQQAAVDGTFYDAMTWIKQTLPSRPARVLLIGSGENDGNRYWPLRARYHLLPHNVLLHHGLNELQERLDTLQKDDYLLVLGELPGLDFADGKLHWADKQAVPVEKVLQGSSATLYQLQ